MNEICIYKFVNKVNGKVYVGKTTNFTERIKKHYRRFLSGEQSNLALYKALKKYGWENFSIEKIEECSEEKLNERECYWIEYYDSYFNGYNETRGGDGGTLYDYKKIVELWEQGNLMSEIQTILGCSKGVVQRALNSYKIKDRRARIYTPVVQYTLEGELVQKYFSITEAAKVTGIDSSGISKCCRGKLKTTGGYVWKYEEEK